MTRRPIAATFVGALTLGLCALVWLPAQAQTTPTPQCPALQLDNPSAGDTVMPGAYVVSGVAYDPTATLGSGVSHVDFFLGSRDDAGTYLGSTVPLANPQSFGPPRFQVQLTIPAGSASSIDFTVYAFDATTDGQTSVAIPVRLGANGVLPPTPNPPVTPVARVSSTCTAVATAVALSPLSPAEIAFTPTPGPQLAGPPPATPGPLLESSGPLLQLANPNPGDVIPDGAYMVSGIAYDPGSGQGAGVDRVQFFLDPRENGGLLLGSATPFATTPGQAPMFSATLVVPKGAPRGQHTLNAYAHSSLTGAEATVSIPIFVGAKPTPTPLP
jgi:hypothetical protein